MLSRRNELIVVGIIALLAAVTLFVWIPYDVETGVYYTHRRQTYIGDSFIPAISVGAILLLSLIQAVLTWQEDPTEDLAEHLVGSTPEPSTLWFLVRIALVIAASLTVMFWAGPVAVWVFKGTGESAQTYRELRSTMPWNTLGFFFGGVMLLQGLMITVATRFEKRQLICSVAAVIILIAIFNGPIDGLLLPPNGDW